MGEELKKLKRKFTVAAIVKSAVIGAACGLFAVGVILLALKLSALTISAGYYVLIAVLTAAIAGGCSWLIFMPTDAKIAKKLDCEYGLLERAQTALQYQSSSGGLFEMQREDTRAALSSLELKKPTFGKLWQYVLIGVLSLALTITAAVIPAGAITRGDEAPRPPTWDELPFEVSQFQIERIEGVIEDVESLALKEALKESMTAELNKLCADLRTAESNGDMTNAVINAIRNVDSFCKAESSYYKIASSLKNLGRADLGRVLAAGAETYRSHALSDGKSVRDFYNDRLDITDNGIAEYLEQFKESLGKAYLDKQDTASGILSGMHLAIILSNVSGEDELYLIINNLTTALSGLLPEIVDREGEEEDESAVVSPEQEALLAKLGEVIETYGYDLSDALSEQSFVFAADKYIYNAVFEILELGDEAGKGVTVGWDLLSQLKSSGEGAGDDDKSHSGGYGGGDVEYGSDDLIYDPDTGEYVPYGQLINKYYAIVNDLLNEGKLTEEQASIIRAYFEMLFSGIKDKS